MSILDQIKADREAGTPGEWHLDTTEGWSGREWQIRSDTCGRDMGEGFMGNAPYYPWQSDKIADARRIARVPQLERIALAGLDPDFIAQVIRAVDGGNTMGAGELGEHISRAIGEACK